MRPYPTPLPAPPERLPYVRCVAEGGELVLRVPSLHRAALLAQAVGQDEMRGLAAAVAGSGAAVLLRGGPAVLEALGALVGCAWADPVLELETPQPRSWDPASTRAYGREVFEELHEAGWGLNRVLNAALVVLRELVLASRVEREVQELAGFFGVRTATSSAGAPSSTPAGPASPPAEVSTA